MEHHFFSSVFLAVLLVGLPGICLSLLLLYRQNEEWLAKWQPIIFFLPLPAGFLIVSVIMETLVLLGKLSFSRVLLLSVLFSVVSLLILSKSIKLDHFKRLFRVRGNRWLIAPILFFVLYIVLTAVPFEFIFDTTDCGTYVSSGIHAFKTGSFRFYDQEIPRADKNFIGAFYHATPPKLYSSAAKFGFEGMMGTGFSIRSFETGLIEPRYFNLHPLWIGLFVKLFGLCPGVWLATPFVALCGLIGIFLLSWALAGKLASVLTTGLLSVFVLQVWIGRYITTEMAVQAAVMNGLAWLLIFSCDRQAMRRGAPAFPMVMTAMMIGISHFARIDSALVIPAIFSGVILWIIFQDKSSSAGLFLLVYGLIALIAGITAVVTAHCYTMETLVHVNVYGMTWLQISLILAGVLLMFLMIYCLRRHSLALSAFFQKHGKIIKVILISIIFLSFIYGFVFRPILDPPDYEAFNNADSTTRSRMLSQMTLRWLGWYLSPLLLPAAFVGLTTLFYKKWTLNTAPVFLVFGLYGVYFLYALRCTPFHYWGMRRFVPVILPALFIGLGYLLQETFLWSLKKKKITVIAALILTYLSSFIFLAQDLHLIHKFVHWKGAIDTLEEISAIVPENSRLVLTNYPGCYLYIPLKLIHGKNVFLLQKSAKRDVVLQIIYQWLHDNERIFLLSANKPEIQEYGALSINLILERQPIYPLLRDFVEKKPDKTSHHQIHYSIVEITLPKMPEGNDVPA